MSPIRHDSFIIAQADDANVADMMHDTAWQRRDPAPFVLVLLGWAMRRSVSAPAPRAARES